MNLQAAKKLTKSLSAAVIAHYAAVNGLNRKNPHTAYEREAAATRRMLEALTEGETIMNTDVDEVMSG